MKRAKRYFNTSGPNIPAAHYTLKREKIIEKGTKLVEGSRYFTIWAPRQTGKTTYFMMLADRLEAKGYRAAQLNVENYKEAPLSALFNYLTRKAAEEWGLTLTCDNFADFANEIEQVKDRRCVLIVDEIEGLNPELFGQFLHTIRNLYHTRAEHCLKSVILVGVSNIVGIVQDHASPFNIADNLEVPYFTGEETFDLLHMHEEETGQLFHDRVKAKISAITANQPGLVNGFAYQLVERFLDAEVIDYEHYLKVEDWYLTEAIDKNIANIISKASRHRAFVEKLLFTEEKEKFKINDEKIKFLYTNGLIKKDGDGNIEFWVPMYKKAVYDAFYPYRNSETKELLREINLGDYFMVGGKLDFDRLVQGFREYVKRRGFRYFREKDEQTGAWKHIKEAAMVYSFESFIQLLLQEIGGKSYLEPHTGLGRSDLVIDIKGREIVVEFKIFRSKGQFAKGKKQICHYAASISAKEAVYLVFMPNYYNELGLKDSAETIDGIALKTYIISYDEEKDF